MQINNTFFEEYLSITNDIVIIKDLKGHIVYPEGMPLAETITYISSLIPIGNNEFFDSTTKEYRHKTEYFMGKGQYIVTRYADITKSKQTIKNLETDQLTQIPNRTRLYADLHKYVKYALQKKEEFLIIMGDIDHFKRVNDQHGHDAGDVVLHNTAQILQNNIRHQQNSVLADQRLSPNVDYADIIGRYGGEEFVILLKRITELSSKIRTDSLREIIASSPILYTYLFDKKTISISPTISLGGIHVQPMNNEEQSEQQIDETVKALIKKADENMYHSKNILGRNASHVTSMILK